MDYSLFLKDPISLLSISLLFFTVISLWFRNKNITWCVFLLFIIFSLFAKRISFISCAYFVILFLSFQYYYLSVAMLPKILYGISFFIITIFFLLQKIPGINNWEVVSNYQFSIDCIPYTLSLNFETPLVGLSVMMINPFLISSWKEWYLTIRKTFLFAFTAILVLIPLAFLLGYIRFNPKSTNIFFVWGLSNLFFTCVTEESFFRFFIQNTLIVIFRRFKYGDHIGIIIASILFGIAHFAGGVKYIIVAAVAGLFYGYAYYSTKRIESSILTHFCVNVTHFLLFSYPALFSISRNFSFTIAHF